MQTFGAALYSLLEFSIRERLHRPLSDGLLLLLMEHPEVIRNIGLQIPFEMYSLRPAA